MRLASLILPALIAAGLLAQSPVAIGPGASGTGTVDQFDWYAGSPSGCTVGTNEFCVGSSGPYGDTYYWSAWLANAGQLPVTSGLPIVGTLNDGHFGGFCTNTLNVAVIQLAAFSWATPNASKVHLVNCMASYSQDVDASNGWYGNCTSGNNAGCSWKSRTPLAIDGCLYLPVERQIAAGGPSIHDATLIKSCDGGATWANPYTVAHSGAAQANGDAPKCGASGAGAACTDATYSGSIMWPAIPSGGAQNWMFFQFGQDGSLPSGVGGGCDTATYICALMADGRLGRVLRTDFPSLDITKWQYVASTNVSHVPTWTSTFSSGVSVVTFGNSNDEVARPLAMLGSPVYLKEFKSYMLLGYQYASPHRQCPMTSPTPFGPWIPSGCGSSLSLGFLSPALGLDYTAVSTNPPRVQLTVVSDYKGAHPGTAGSEGSPYFTRLDITLGRQPYGNGDVPAYRYTGLGATGRVNSGWIFNSGDEPGAFKRNGLAWAFDFMDAGGDTSGYPFFHDVVNNSAIVYPCYDDGGTTCGVMNVKGLYPRAYGMQISDGYSARMVSSISDVNVGAQNAPAAMQGNGTYTVAGVFRLDGSSYGQTLWSAGNPWGDATGVMLTGTVNSLSNNLALDWGILDRYHYQSTFVPTTGDWYFISAVVTSGSPGPTAKLWVGVGGALADEFAGVSRVSTGGSPTQLPSVAAGPFVLGSPGQGGHVADASYAALLVYNRALSDVENRVLYQLLETKMLERGVTVQ